MSLSHDDVLAIMSYADGELPAEDHARVQALVLSDPEARDLLRSFGIVGEALREAHEVTAEGLQIDVADAVMGKLDEQDAVAVSAARGAAVHDLASARALRSRRLLIAAGVGVSFAAAAAFMIVVGQRASLLAEDPHTRPVIVASAAVSGASPLMGVPAAAAAAFLGGVDVNQVESPSHQVSVFYLPAVLPAASASASSVVVWINEDNGGH